MNNPNTQQKTSEFMKTQGNQMYGTQTQGNQMQGNQMQGTQTQGNQMQGTQGQQGKQMKNRRRHPHSFYLDDINFQMMDPLDIFNNYMTKGFFNDFDLSLYGLGNMLTGTGNMMTGTGNTMTGTGNMMTGTGNMMTGTGNTDQGFFGQDYLNQFLKQNQQGSFQMFRSMKRNTRVENGRRTTITEVKTVTPDGKVLREVKEETDDGKGNRQVRYLDSIPQEEKQKIKSHKNRQNMLNQGTNKQGMTNQGMMGQTTGQAMNKGQNTQTNMQGTTQTNKQGEAQTTNK